MKLHTDVLRAQSLPRAGGSVNAYDQWMVASNLRTIRETGVSVAAQVALLRANGYPRIADAVARAVTA